MAITNFSRNYNRRVDIIVGVFEDDDMDNAQGVLQGLMDEYVQVLTNPGSETMVVEFGDSFVDINMRCWVNGSDYWGGCSTSTCSPR